MKERRQFGEAILRAPYQRTYFATFTGFRDLVKDFVGNWRLGIGNPIRVAAYKWEFGRLFTVSLAGLWDMPISILPLDVEGDWQKGEKPAHIRVEAYYPNVCTLERARQSRAMIEGLFNYLDSALLPEETGQRKMGVSGEASDQPQSATTEELFIDNIDSFAAARNVTPQEVRGLLPLELSEDQIQTYLEEIVGENFHQQDWGGEINDLMTSHVVVEGKRLRAAFVLKGNGTKGKLTISKCGKNGDQIVRLADAPVDLYVIQHVDEIDERVIYDLKGKIQLKNSKGHKCQMCIMDGTDTARILRAYGKIK